MHVWVCLHVYIYTHIYMQAHAVFKNICVYAHMGDSIQIYTLEYIYTYMHMLERGSGALETHSLQVAMIHGQASRDEHCQWHRSCEHVYAASWGPAVNNAHLHVPGPRKRTE